MLKPAEVATILLGDTCNIPEARQPGAIELTIEAKLRRSGKGIRLVVVGPSGAGKDTILRQLEATLPLDADIAIARRYITRPADPGGERHIPVTHAAYAALASSGAFVLGWQSHGLAYGIGRELVSCLDAGMCVVVNGSRAYVKDARTRFAGRLSVVLVTASPDVLAKRLAARNRETREESAARLARTAEIADDVTPDLVIRNDGEVSASVTALRDHLLRAVAPCA